MNVEESRRKGQRTLKELTETDEAFDRLRAGFVARLLETDPKESEEREQLYLAVKVLDKVRATMIAVVRSAQDTQLIEEAADAFRKQTKVKNG